LLLLPELPPLPRLDRVLSLLWLELLRLWPVLDPELLLPLLL
jgi:hypothetical protein